MSVYTPVLLGSTRVIIPERWLLYTSTTNNDYAASPARPTLFKSLNNRERYIFSSKNFSIHQGTHPTYCTLCFEIASCIRYLKSAFTLMYVIASLSALDNALYCLHSVKERGFRRAMEDQQHPGSVKTFNLHKFTRIYVVIICPRISEFLESGRIFAVNVVGTFEILVRHPRTPG